MSIASLTSISATIALIGLALAVAACGIGLIARIPSVNNSSPRQARIKNTAAIIGVIGGGFCFAIALILIVFVGVWWCFDYFFVELTPSNLAISCLLIGPAPLVGTLLAGLLAKIAGGSVDASGAKNCILFGTDIAPLIYTLFMFYHLAFITIGLAILGLMGSVVWALLRMF